jgi:undecaprenyl-diphosphatase
MSEESEPAVGKAAAPPTERLATHMVPGSRLRRVGGPILEDLSRLDLAVYRAIAATSSPSLDASMRRLSNLANHSKIWLVVAAGMGAVGGRAGRRAAAAGAVAIALNSATVNLVIKRAGRRTRPDREAAAVPAARHVTMPSSASFPSGHTASGFAFAASQAGVAPLIAGPLRLLATAVGYSRVHTGVHYPGDVVIGALIGTTVGESVALAVRWIERRPHIPGRSSS